MKRACAVGALLLLAGCGGSMSDQPRYQQYEPAPLFRDGQTIQQPQQGTVSRGDAPMERPALTADLLARGRQQFDAFCAPCHARTGDGDGTVVRRGMPRPPSYHIDRLRSAPDAHFFDVMTNGYGVMYSYASRIRPSDRWAIVAYIRALQLSQHASPSDVPADMRRQLFAESAK